MIVLDKRLKTVYDMLPSCDTVADIGTDHGRLGCALLKDGKCKTVMFTDISAPSLNKARELVKKLELTDSSMFFVGNGVNCLPCAPDCCVIAGMGGNTICEILKTSQLDTASIEWVLQPNTDAHILRGELKKLRLAISDEKLIYDSKWYTVIKAAKGNADYSMRELYAGPCLLRAHSPELKAYALKRINDIEKAMQAAAKMKSHPMAGDIKQEYAVWKELVSTYEG